jgi:hypothetical protein
MKEINFNIQPEVDDSVNIKYINSFGKKEIYKNVPIDRANDYIKGLMKRGCTNIEVISSTNRTQVG